MKRLRNYDYKGTRILEIDFTGADRNETAATLESFLEYVGSMPENKSANVIINATQATLDFRLVNRAKSFLPLFASRIRRSAAFGLSPFVHVAAKLLGQDIERRNQIFNGREEALEWVTQP